jgi:N-methylhydantoinase A
VKPVASHEPVEIGIDVGGTFTDAIVRDRDRRVRHVKVPTQPADISESFIAALSAAEALAQEGSSVVRLVHGTTIATNTVVERSGAHVGLLATQGFGDTSLMMQGRGYTAGLPPELMTNYHDVRKPEPLVPRSRIVEIPERVDSAGYVVVAIDEEAVREAVRELIAQGVEAFAVSFLWSFLNDAHERRAGEIIRELAPDAFVTLSSEIAPRTGEYTRTMAAVINSYVGPRARSYLDKVESRLKTREFPCELRILHSAGGTVSVDDARHAPVRLIGSGPVGGTVAARDLGLGLDESHVIAVDMGGTTFDVSLVVQGELTRRSAGVIHQYEFAVPTVDIESIGSGGGSIVHFDAATRSLRVGPRSAGSFPGPACYGRGGELPTVTDCNLVVGYLDPAAFMDGRQPLDMERAEHVLGPLADELGLSILELAHGALQIVDHQMADLMRQMTFGRGYDPRDFAVFAYGGGGPLHAGVYAREYGAQRVVVPGAAVASVWSAYGASGSETLVVEERSVAFQAPFDHAALEAAFQRVEEGARARLAAFGVAPDVIETRRSADLKYGAQVHVLDVQVPDRIDAESAGGILERFDERYETIFGRGTAYREAGTHLTAIRVEAWADESVAEGRGGPVVDVASSETASSTSTRPVCWDRAVGHVETPVYHGRTLGRGEDIHGPAVIELGTTTVPIHAGQVARRDGLGNLVLDLGNAR